MTLEITTSRLHLIAATPALLRAELSDQKQWRAMLGADIAPDWPAEHWDEPAIRYTIEHMLKSQADIGWGPWYMLLPSQSGRTLIGTAGLKGHPSSDGTIEVGYGIVASCRGNGYAPEASRAVIAWACRCADVRFVVAETFPHLHSSIRVMEKLGMKFIGDGSEPGAIRYGLTRAEFESWPAPPSRSVQTSPQR